MRSLSLGRSRIGYLLLSFGDVVWTFISGEGGRRLWVNLFCVGASVRLICSVSLSFRRNDLGMVCNFIKFASFRELFH